MQCNGICSKYSVKKIIPRNVGYYESGHKRCLSFGMEKNVHVVVVNFDQNHEV
jgi:hypothetical protein